MANNTVEAADRDAEWMWTVCDRKRIRPTENQEEDFVHKVAEVMADLGYTESQARRHAFKLVFGVEVI